MIFFVFKTTGAATLRDRKLKTSLIAPLSEAHALHLFHCSVAFLGLFLLAACRGAYQGMAWLVFRLGLWTGPRGLGGRGGVRICAAIKGNDSGHFVLEKAIAFCLKSLEMTTVFAKFKICGFKTFFLINFLRHLFRGLSLWNFRIKK